VKSKDDIEHYFQLLSLISLLAFCWVSMIVEDASADLPTQSLMTGKQKKRRKSQSKRRSSSKNKQRSKRSNSGVFTRATENADVELGQVQPLPQVQSPVSEQYRAIQASTPPISENNATEPLVVSQTPHNPTAQEQKIWPLIQLCFTFSGFAQCTIAHVASGIIATTLIAFMSDFVKDEESSKLEILILGGGFQFISLVSLFIFRRLVGQSRRLYQVILTLLASGTVALMVCSFGGFMSLNVCILIVGFLMGPLQYLSAVLGSRVARSLSGDNGEILWILSFCLVTWLSLSHIFFLSYDSTSINHPTIHLQRS
jgi:hypothetical protein